jgi:hypothetical protein
MGVFLAPNSITFPIDPPGIDLLKSQALTELAACFTPFGDLQLSQCEVLIPKIAEGL